MPTYEFRCLNGHEFTRFYKTISGAQSRLPCPECNSVAERQLSGGGGLVFKGSGFYLTDYGKNAHRKPEVGKPDVGRQTSPDVGSQPSDVGEKQSESKVAKDGGAKPDAKAEGREPKAESPKPKAESREPKSESRKTKSRKPSAE